MSIYCQKWKRRNIEMPQSESDVESESGEVNRKSRRMIMKANMMIMMVMIMRMMMMMMMIMSPRN